MSIEHILKSASAKNRGKKKHRGSGIAAFDERYTGKEPIWDDWQTWPVSKFHDERSRMFGFYNYYSTAKELKPGIIAWMEANGYSKEEVRAIKRAPDYLPGVTTGSICAALNRGMPTLHPQLKDHLMTLAGCLNSVVRPDDEFVRENIRDAIANGMKSADEGENPELKAVVKKPGISPFDLMRQKVKVTIMQDLDVLLDSWMDLPEGSVLPTFNIYEKMKGHGLPALCTEMVKRWIVKHRDEMKAALEGTDPDLVEGYRYLSKKQLKERVEALTTFVTDLDKFKASVKATKAPREKKLPAATKQVEKIKYLKESPEFKITSINPIRLVGAYRVITFDTRNRYALDYHCSGSRGFLFSGSKITNADGARLRCKKLRKPEKDLQTFITGTSKQIDKLWAELTTKEGKQNTRLNEHMVLLRVFEEPST